MDIIEPKAQVKAILDEIDGTVAYQQRVSVIKELPAFIFSIVDNTPAYLLEKDVAYQNIRVVIDIFAKTSKETGTLLIELQTKMLEYGYMMESSRDVPDDDFSHLSTVFNINI